VAALNADLQQLRQAMPLLNEDYRIVLQLRFVEGYDVTETAQIMARNVGAIRVLQHRALRQLARLINP
jgi:RNA polymerase sigma-70 factor (ECF subfamily)